MRLSTAPDRDGETARSVLAAALAAGIALFDTSDAYGHDDADVGHNERLISAAIAAFRTPSRPVVVTKGGLQRPGGAWVPNGRAKHLTAAARGSRERLARGSDPLDLYLLHAVDPQTPLATSVRALAKLRDGGVTRAIGLSNVGVHQLDQALGITPIDAVEVELSPYRLAALRGGLVARCRDRGIQLLAHRPLGGPAGGRRLERDAIATTLAARAGLTPYELALVWLATLGVVPLPGATRVATVHSIARAAAASVPREILDALDTHWRDGGEVEPARVAVSDPAREVVILMGMPAAGKSTLAEGYVARGYLRLNRDERGGTLADLARVLATELAGGATRVVLDNTYGTRATRAPVIAAASKHGVPVRCVVVETSLEDAQANAVARVLSQHGRLLEPTELARVNAIAPGVQFRYRRTYEPPALDEGFASVEPVPFVRAPSGGGKRALIVELDDLVWRKRPRSPDDIDVVPFARERIAAFAAAGYVVAGTTWLTPTSVDAPLAQLLGVPIVVARCTHPAGPPICWCRKPLPGLALALAHAHGLDLAHSVHVGRGPADRGFASRAGMRYADVADGFPDP